jgi:hypothetical protein
MAPDQRGEVGDIVVTDIQSVQPDLANGFLHVDGVPVHDGVESEAKGAKLLFLSLLKRAPDNSGSPRTEGVAGALTQRLLIARRSKVLTITQSALPACILK